MTMRTKVLEHKYFSGLGSKSLKEANAWISSVRKTNPDKTLVSKIRKQGQGYYVLIEEANHDQD